MPKKNIKGVTQVDDGFEIDLEALRNENKNEDGEAKDFTSDELDSIFNSAYEEDNEADESQEDSSNEEGTTEDEESEDQTAKSAEDEGDLEDDKNEGDKKKPGRAQTRIVGLSREKNELKEKLRLAEEARLNAELTAKRATFDANKRAALAEKNALENQVNLAIKLLTESQTQADSEGVAKATDALSQARTKLTVVEAALSRFDSDEEILKTEIETKKTEHKQTNSGQMDVATAEKLAAKFLRGHPKMYVDPTYRQMIDSLSNSLRKEGDLSPDSQEFWNELDDRVTEVLSVQDEPNTEKKKTNGAKPKQPVSSQGSNKSSATKNNAQANTNKVHLSQEELKMAKFFGMTPVEYAEYKNLDDGSVFLPKRN